MTIPSHLCQDETQWIPCIVRYSTERWRRTSSRSFLALENSPKQVYLRECFKTPVGVFSFCLETKTCFDLSLLDKSRRQQSSTNSGNHEGQARSARSLVSIRGYIDQSSNQGNYLFSIRLAFSILKGRHIHTM